jgi:hypothetical protein
VCGFSYFGVGERRGSGPGWWLCVEAMALGCMVGNNFIGSGSCMCALGDFLVSASMVKLSAPPKRLSHFMRVEALDVCERFALCSLGCGRLGRVAF